MKRFVRERKDIYVYFNNGVQAYAVKNADTLKKNLRRSRNPD